LEGRTLVKAGNGLNTSLVREIETAEELKLKLVFEPIITMREFGISIIKATASFSSVLKNQSNHHITFNPSHLIFIDIAFIPDYRREIES
jgi:hypothetical protein